MTTTSAPTPPPTEPGLGGRSSARAALAVFIALIVVAGPLILFDLARDRWFVLDEWDFLVDRQIGSLHDLFRPHNEHWSTLPIIAYRVMYALVGLHHYRAYQAMVVALHLAAVVLLRVVMRRAGVGPWTATVVAALLILFGAGQEDIVWAFQIGFVGSLVFGLVQLILADHDGGWERRDWLGLLAGAAALMCSGVGVAMVVVVGVSVWLRRGWRAAAGHVLPLMALYLVWWAVIGRSGSTAPSHAGLPHVVGEVIHWDISGIWDAFQALGQATIVAVALLVVLVLGLVLCWRPSGSSRVRGSGATVVGLLCGALVFLTITGSGRWYYPTDSPGASRYLYLVVALLLPAFGLAVDAIGRRWPVGLPVVLVVMALGVPGNVGQFGDGRYTGPSMVAHRELVLALAASPLITRVSPHLVPLPRSDPRLTAGWLAEAERAGKLSAPGVVPPILRAQVSVALGFQQGAVRAPPLTHCRTGTTVLLDPAPNRLVKILGGVVVVANRDSATGVWSEPLLYDTQSFFGPRFTVLAPHLHLRIRSRVRGEMVTVCD